MDIKDLSEQQILELLSKGEKIPYYPDISKPTRETAVQTFEDVLNQEKKLSRALSRGISEQKGFKGSTKIPDIIKELSSDMGIQTPDYEFKYKDGLAGWAKKDYPFIGLNPQYLSEFGREAVIAHELRHLKENPLGSFDDNSIRKILYTTPMETGNRLTDILESLKQSIQTPLAVKKEEGKSLQYFNKVKDRLFPNDKLKYQVDALDAYDFLEKGHFKDSFLKQNLQRISKKLPIIGTAATALGVATAPNPAEAAILEGMSNIIPGGVSELGVSDEQKELDRQYFKRIRQSSKRQGK